MWQCSYCLNLIKICIWCLFNHHKLYTIYPAAEVDKRPTIWSMAAIRSYFYSELSYTVPFETGSMGSTFFLSTKLNSTLYLNSVINPFHLHLLSPWLSFHPTIYLSTEDPRSSLPLKQRYFKLIYIYIVTVLLSFIFGTSYWKIHIYKIRIQIQSITIPFLVILYNPIFPFICIIYYCENMLN